MEREKRLRLEELEKIIPPKEKRFIEELEADCSKADAAIRAGYGRSRDGKVNRRSAATAASRILAKEEVAEYRALRAERTFEEHGLSRDTVMSEAVKVYRRCMQAEPVMQWNPDTKEWEESGEFRFDSKGALKALELMGEHVGAFEKENDPAKNKIDVNINVVDKASATSDIVP
ncbi:MAG: terminase small subunit [Oscillospiraceae bacterium]|nr:terminase small subunit [Oscillospiraceae bacterium]